MTAWGSGATPYLDVPVPGDFVWWSSDQSAAVDVWGAAVTGELPVPRNYNGAGKADLAVWRAPEGKWYLQLSGATQSRTTDGCAWCRSVAGL